MGDAAQSIRREVTMQKRFIVEYGGLQTIFTQDKTSENTWHWRTVDHGTRVDGSDCDSTAVLYMLFGHMQDAEARILVDQI
jgi:hypothetical protein